MKKFKIAIVQQKTLTPDLLENTATAIKFIKEAKAENADFVLFPECFLTSYYAPKICKRLIPVSEIESDAKFLEWCENAITEDCYPLNQICKTAADEHIGVCITAFTKGKKYPQNSAIVIDRNGKILLKYAKVHTCDFDWERYLESGDEFKVCDFDGIRIGVMICYDREYPESARELMLQGAELILVPNDCGDMAPRLRELSVTAMQNMCGVAMANPPGYNMGRSCAYHPMVWGENAEHTTADNTSKSAANNTNSTVNNRQNSQLNATTDNSIITADSVYDGIIFAEFDIDEIRNYRAKEDLGKYRKPHAYHHLV